MREKESWKLYREIAKGFRRKRIDYVLVGAVAINLYAKQPDQLITTQDLDILIRPSWEHWTGSLEVLKKLGFKLEAAGESLEDLSLPELLQAFKHGARVRAIHREVAVDLILEMKGFDFVEVFKRHKVFTLARVPIRVARLEQLLESKRLLGRTKDRLFLTSYGGKVKEILAEERKRKGKRSR